MNLDLARDRVASVLYRATARIERQQADGSWNVFKAAVPCSIRAQRSQPSSAQPDGVATGQRLLTWRIRCATGTGIEIGDRITADTPDYGIVAVVVGSVASSSLTVSETAYGTREEWAAEGVELTFIRYDQTTDTETTYGPYFARKLQSDTREATIGNNSIGSPVNVWLRLDAGADVEVGDIVPELGGGEVTQVHPAIDGAVEIAVRSDAGAADWIG